MRKVRFQGKEFLLTGDNDGALTTEELYVEGRCSYAHLMPDGRIMRFLKQIGAKEDLEFLEEVDAPEPTLGGLLNLLKGWK